MGLPSDIATIARWEVKKTFSSMGRSVLPVAVVLLVLLLAVTDYTAQSGIHIQDGIYRVGVDSTEVRDLIARDSRFTVYLLDSETLRSQGSAFDLVITGSTVNYARTDRGRAAAKTLARDYTQYQASVYNQEQDLFAAYPLWIDIQNIKSELNFTATQQGQAAFNAVPRVTGVPIPEGSVEPIETPAAGISLSEDQLRTSASSGSSSGGALQRYTDIFGPSSPLGTFKTPSQSSPPLPFDSIILIFVFIFPLYFSSQFFMMSVMNERIGRRGELLLSTPARPLAIVVGKALPYLLGMLAVSGALIAYLHAPPVVIFPLIPVILFFLSSALLIGMVSRSFRELSFISIFFSTVATSYLFFPSVFANVHVISLISPLTLIVLTLQGTPFSAIDYAYSSSLFFLTSAILFYVGIRNFREEPLFSQQRLLEKIRLFIAGSISLARPALSLFALNALLIPFVFMVQLMLLVVLFNLPIPLSLILLLITAAFVEELAKSIGLVTLREARPSLFTWRRVGLLSAATAAGFLFGEKTPPLRDSLTDNRLGLRERPLPLTRPDMAASAPPFCRSGDHGCSSEEMGEPGIPARPCRRDLCPLSL